MLVLVLKIMICLLIAVTYTIIGYNISNYITSGPNWKTIDQILIWVLWPIFPFMFVCLVFGLIGVAIILSVFLMLAFIYDFCKSLINKYFRK